MSWSRFLFSDCCSGDGAGCFLAWQFRGGLSPVYCREGLIVLASSATRLSLNVEVLLQLLVLLLLAGMCISLGFSHGALIEQTWGDCHVFTC